jgi:hypothetical protein
MQRELKHGASAQFVLCVLTLAVLSQGPAAIGSPAPLVAARVRTDEVCVDGRLDEAAWRHAVPASGFRQQEPGEGAPATEDTEVRVLFDEANLYVGILARDREPEKVVARILQRDKLLEPWGYDNRQRFGGDDAVAILLDPFRDRRNAFVFATNANGAEFDALITDENPAMNVDWRAVWAVRAERNAVGWSAELAIPFRTLRYPPSKEARPWGFNAWRVIRRKNEQTLWRSFSRDGGGFHRVSQAGELLGLERLPRPGRNLELKPFGLAGFDQAEERGLVREARLDAGLDAKWEVRPGLVLDGTVNPDFAQVESDNEQVNLTRFELFHPEKRDFFLENAGIFDFGARGLGTEPPPFLAFFSRRIGIADDGEVPVLGGLRLSGRAGRQTVGLLDMVTGPAFGEGHVNWGVLRLKRDLGGSGYLGGILTDRRSGEAANTVVGADASLWPTAALNLQGFVAATRTSGPGGDDLAWRVAADYTGDRNGLLAEHLVVGPDVEAQAGFVTRTDIRRTEVYGRHTLRPHVLGLRKVDLWLGGIYATRLDGERQDGRGGAVAGLEWNSGETLSFGGFRGFTRLDAGFDLSDLVPVPIGDYDVRLVVAEAGTRTSRPVVLSGGGEFMRIYGGSVDSFGGKVQLTPGAHLLVKLAFTRNRARLPGGSFVGDVWSTRVGWAFSTRLQASAFVQYNSLDETLTANVRLGFIHRPGSDLFVVLNEERAGSPLALKSRAFALKLTWLARF